MCFAGGNGQNDPASAGQSWRKYVDSGQEQKDAAKMGFDDQGQKNYLATREAQVKSQLGSNYIEPGNIRAKGAPPLAPDLTDELLQKTRTNFLQRLQMGKNLNSSFGNTQLGGFDLSKPVLGSS